jgi:hypothetical protein
LKETSDQRPPARQQLMMLTMGRVIAPVIWALAELRVGDHLADGPLPIGELADRTGTHEATLLRVLRCASAFGVVTEQADRTFVGTAMSELLRADSDESVRDLVLMNGTELFWRPYEGIVHTLRTGKPALEEIFGVSLFDYLESRPDLAEIFHRAMTAASKRGSDLIAAQIDLAPSARVADIGGGQGFLLAEVLQRHPEARGVLFDRPAAVEGGRALLGASAVAGRVEYATGDFFAGGLPEDCDAYLLKHVLHDWPDEEAVRILRNVRAAAGDRDDVRLYVVEFTIGEPNTMDFVKLLDMDMMISAGGRERTVEEYARLADQAGFDLAGSRPAAGMAVIEFRAR